MKKITLVVLLYLLIQCSFALPKGFVYLNEVAPSIPQEIRYHGSNNFVGKPIDGYQASTCILTREAAIALAAVQADLLPQHLSLFVYDCYRPQRAVNTFVAWSQDETDQKNKNAYYPNVDKSQLFEQGYIAARSGHTRGSTIDLTIVKLTKDGKLERLLPMGTTYDFLDPLSHPLTTSITGIAMKNRLLLRNEMIKHGFNPLVTEWWHFTLANEPFKNTYFNFPVI